MDRRLDILRLFFFAIGTAIALVAACSSAPEAVQAMDAPRASDIRALKWVAEDTDKVAFLTRLPSVCETQPVSAEQAEQRTLGRLAFESPALLGGAAARMELSCASCHRNGRGNPDFFLEGLSDKPGTADVTSSVLSKVRGDGNFNPVAIPDLAARDGNQIRDRRSAEFRAKVRGLVVEEFDGQEPTPYVFDALIAYLDSLESSACTAAAGNERLSLGRDLNAAETAYQASVNPALDEATRLFYLRVARSALGRIYERFVGPVLVTQRRELLGLSEGLRQMGEVIRAKRSAVFIEPDWIGLAGRLGDGAKESLYSPEVLQSALKD